MHLFYHNSESHLRALQNKRASAGTTMRTIGQLLLQVWFAAASFLS